MIDEAMNIFKAIADKTSWIYVAGPSKFFDEAQSLRTIQKLAREYVKHHAGQQSPETLIKWMGHNDRQEN